MANITKTTADVFIPEVWSDDATEAAEFAAVIQKRVDRKWESQAKVGDLIRIPQISNLTANNKSADTDVTFEAITQLDTQITVNTYKYAAFLLENIVDVQANVDLRQKYSKKIGYALTRVREVDLAAIFDGFSTTVGTLGVELTSDNYLEAWQKLAEAGLLETGPDPGEEFSIILSPAAYAAALKVDVFANRQYNTAGDAVQRAKVGDIYGFPVFISNLLESDATNQHDCIAMHRNAIGLVVQEEIPMRSDFLIEKIGDAVVGWTIYGVAEINRPVETAGSATETDNWGVYLKTV